MKRAKNKKNVINVFSDINITLNLGSDFKPSAFVACVLALALAAKLLTMSSSEVIELMQLISSYISALAD